MLVKTFCCLNSHNSNFLWLVEGIFLLWSCFLEAPPWCAIRSFCQTVAIYIIFLGACIFWPMTCHTGKPHSVLEWVVNAFLMETSFRTGRIGLMFFSSVWWSFYWRNYSRVYLSDAPALSFWPLCEASTVWGRCLRLLVLSRERGAIPWQVSILLHS